VQTFNRIAIAGATMVFIAGCSSTPTPLLAARSVPADRIYYNSAPVSNNPAKIVVVKDEGTWASFGYHQLFLNGKVAASLRTGERIEFAVDPADYIIGVLPVASTSTQGQSLGGYAITSIDQSVAAGKTYYYRVLVDGDNTSRIQRFIPE
jgi:hypothetical protein